MKKISSKVSFFIVRCTVGFCTALGLSAVGAGETVLHEKVALKGQVAALQNSDAGYDEEKPKQELGVDSLTGANLEGEDLSGADMRWNRLQEANLAHANLQGANLKGANLKKANLQGANLRGANLARANLEDADLRGADLTGTRNLILRQIAPAIYDKDTKFPEGMTFEDIPKYSKDSLKSALGVKTLVGAEAHGMILRWGDFEGADMRWSSLQASDLTGANLSETNLSAANLHNANLSKADLQKANLKNASLQGSDLRQSNLHGAEMTGADMHGADLRGADLRGVKNITTKQLAESIVDMRTRLPEGITLKLGE